MAGPSPKYRIQDLETNRFGKKPFTQEERLERLERIYDAALCWLENCVQNCESKGTASATMIIERTRIEINDMVRTGTNSNKQTIILQFEPLDKADEKPE